MAFLRELDTLQTRREEYRRAHHWNPRWRRRQGEDQKLGAQGGTEPGGKQGDGKGRGGRKGK